MYSFISAVLNTTSTLSTHVKTHFSELSTILSTTIGVTIESPGSAGSGMGKLGQFVGYHRLKTTILKSGAHTIAVNK